MAASRILSFVLLLGMAVFLLLLLAGIVDLGFGMDALAGFTLGPLLLLHLLGNIIQLKRKSSATHGWISLAAWSFIYLSVILIAIQSGNAGRPFWG